MNNPRIFIVAFFIACLILAITLWLLSSQSPVTIQGTVISQTLTQSLDGHRRYLNVMTDDNQTLLITSPATVECPKGSRISLELESTLFQQQSRYRFKACYRQQSESIKP
ncbi:hypothetical protein H2O73_18875 [Vibrio sp. 404]|uniref:Uncharacterized protein n=1 Tax=Vibrio marinisediminis TaxID=2758441 RepID=A0A7W2IVG5_9VIBR|nr:hypothetical protein [Vibrio marinisediminis]MBA5764424.1 hypothetical protein [Vibrio marinisediminis]